MCVEDVQAQRHAVKKSGGTGFLGVGAFGMPAPSKEWQMIAIQGRPAISLA